MSNQCITRHPIDNLYSYEGSYIRRNDAGRTLLLTIYSKVLEVHRIDSKSEEIFIEEYLKLIKNVVHLYSPQYSLEQKKNFIVSVKRLYDFGHKLNLVFGINDVLFRCIDYFWYQRPSFFKEDIVCSDGEFLKDKKIKDMTQHELDVVILIKEIDMWYDLVKNVVYTKDGPKTNINNKNRKELKQKLKRLRRFSNIAGLKFSKPPTMDNVISHSTAQSWNNRCLPYHYQQPAPEQQLKNKKRILPGTVSLKKITEIYENLLLL